jgi:NNP family nitrate/nitrite transporter-like MFS transporter
MAGSDDGGVPVSLSTGKPFRVPVDSEHKSKVLHPWSAIGVHHTAFFFSWVAFMAAFISTFAPAALLPVIRDSIDLTRTDLGNAGIAAVCGAIASRVAMGNFVDNYGPRYGIGLCLGLTAPAVFCIGLSTNAAGFIVSRLFIGFSLACFVACQFWCTSMFTTRIVGSANAFAAGWGNMGGGVTHFVMPLIFDGIKNGGVAPFTAWRWAFFVPAGLQVILTIATLAFAQDLPDGQYKDLRAKGAMAKPGGWPVWKAAIFNYRTWIMTLTYGYCFGVELTVDNVISNYIFDQFGVSLAVAGMLGSVFGLMNLFTRALGGIVSDLCAKRWGMRGRLWALWSIQTAGGILCGALYFCSHSLGATMAVIVIFSIACQMSCGLSFGVAPFVSKRSTGLVSGFTGAGGNVGGAVTQAAFFTSAAMTVPAGFLWMGVLTVAVTALYTLIFFPMWGGMFCAAKPNVTEEDYYLAEFSPEERAEGLGGASLKFAHESRSNRGFKREQEAIAADKAVAQGV